MTVSSYNQRQIYLPSRDKRHIPSLNALQLFQNSGCITGAIIAWITITVVMYLVAVYSFFGLGVGLQQKSLVIKNLTESNTIAELNLQQRQTEFAKNNQDILESMEKISDMRYVLPADTAVSRADTPDS